MQWWLISQQSVSFAEKNMSEHLSVSDGRIGTKVVTRRNLFGQTLMATACGVAGGIRLSNVSAGDLSEAASSEIPGTPEEAMRKLQEGNQRFAAGKSMAFNRDIDRVREVAKAQKPFAAFLGCADSRVPIEIIFDQGFGDLFVTRIAGNVASSENIGSLEFGTQILGAKVIYVLGHTECGAVNATMKGTEVPGQISGLFQHIRPAVKMAGGDLNKAIIENVRNQAILLAEASPVISQMVRRGELIVAGGIYDLATGVVSDVPVHVA
jgi:carbonic anhydrase